MDDICSDWESYDETEQITHQSETKSKKPILPHHQMPKESSPQLHHQQQQQQLFLQCHQSAQYNQQAHYQTSQNHYQIKQLMPPKPSNFIRPKDKSVEKQQSKKKSNGYLKPNK